MTLPEPALFLPTLVVRFAARFARLPPDEPLCAAFALGGAATVICNPSDAPISVTEGFFALNAFSFDSIAYLIERYQTTLWSRGVTGGASGECGRRTANSPNRGMEPKWRQ